MSLHPSAFDYIQPTLEQVANINMMRVAAADYARAIETRVPEGPDKTFILRQLREVAMWVNVAITRNSDGSPL